MCACQCNLLLVRCKHMDNISSVSAIQGCFLFSQNFWLNQFKCKINGMRSFTGNFPEQTKDLQWYSTFFVPTVGMESTVPFAQCFHLWCSCQCNNYALKIVQAKRQCCLLLKQSESDFCFSKKLQFPHHKYLQYHKVAAVEYNIYFVGFSCAVTPMF